MEYSVNYWECFDRINERAGAVIAGIKTNASEARDRENKGEVERYRIILTDLKSVYDELGRFPSLRKLRRIEGRVERLKDGKIYIRWSDFESWRDYGIEHYYNELNPCSLRDSQNKKERSWYKYGARRKWLDKFKFKRKILHSRWRSYEEWRDWGLRRRYDNSNPVSLKKSIDKEKRSWYNIGCKYKWINKFPLKRKKVFFKYPNFRSWKKNGIEREHNERNVYSLLRSRDDSERSWAVIGRNNGWLSEFPFIRIHKLANFHKDFDNLKRELEKIIKENNGEFPSQNKLRSIGMGGLLSGITKYHCGLNSVRERIGYNEQKREELARELEQIILGVGR